MVSCRASRKLRSKLGQNATTWVPVHGEHFTPQNKIESKRARRLDRGALPADGATGKAHAYVKPAFCSRLAIHDLSQLRKLTRRRKKEFFPWLPEALCHQASAVRAGVSGNGLFPRPRHRCRREVDRHNHGEALLYSSVEVPFTRAKRWSRRIHGRFSITLCCRRGNAKKTVIPRQVITLASEGRPVDPVRTPSKKSTELRSVLP